MSNPTPGTVVWFDLYANDSEDARSFYGKMFGWSFMAMGIDDAYVIHNGDGAAIGSLLKRAADVPPSHPQNTAIYIQVDNLNQSYDAVTELGATTLIEPSPVPGTNNAFALVMDPQHNMLGLIAPASTMSAAA